MSIIAPDINARSLALFYRDIHLQSRRCGYFAARVTHPKHWEALVSRGKAGASEFIALHAPTLPSGLVNDLTEMFVNNRSQYNLS